MKISIRERRDKELVKIHEWVMDNSKTMAVSNGGSFFVRKSRLIVNGKNEISEKKTQAIEPASFTKIYVG